MYISVQFYKDEAQGFGGNRYTYKTRLAFLRVGDKVIAPVKNRGTGAIEGKKAVVFELNVPEPSFECREITEFWKEPEAAI